MFISIIQLLRTLYSDISVCIKQNVSFTMITPAEKSTNPVIPNTQHFQSLRQLTDVYFTGKRIVLEPKLFKAFGKACEIQRSDKGILIHVEAF